LALKYLLLLVFQLCGALEVVSSKGCGAGGGRAGGAASLLAGAQVERHLLGFWDDRLGHADHRLNLRLRLIRLDLGEYHVKKYAMKRRPLWF